jgi:8-oxo-dGTP diphosphatase
MNGHCFRCGGELPAAPPVACRDCGYEMYVNARPTASLLITDGDGRILLLRRSRPPSSGMWETPGGFCDGWEEPVEAALREGREELGVEVILGPFVGMFVGTYEFQDEPLPVLDCFWWAALPEGAELKLDPAESSEAGWFKLDDPPALAFTTMTRAVQAAALNRWCQKADWSE